MTSPTADQLREHLAYEIHYLVLAAIRFPTIGGREATIYQDSALMHARNLLEFTQPTKPKGGAWWIVEVGGSTPPKETAYKEWTDFINTGAAHLGQRRVKGSNWPVDKNNDRLARLSHYALQRICDLLPTKANDDRVEIVLVLTRLGLDYLDSPSEKTLAAIARLIDEPYQAP